MKLRFLAVAIALTAFATNPAQAQSGLESTAPDVSVLSLERVSVAGGLNYLWYAAPFESSDPVPTWPRGFEVGLYGAYNLTPHASLTASLSYMPDNKWIEQRIGIRFRLFRGYDR